MKPPQIVENYQDVKDKAGKLVPAPGFFSSMRFQFQGEWVSINRHWPPKYEGKLGDFPTFPLFSPSMREIVSDSLVDLSLLIVWNGLLMLGAYVAFLRYDVRPE